MSASPSSSEVSPAYSRPASTVSNCPSYSPAVFAALVVATRSSSAIVGGPVHCAAGAHVAPGEAVHCAAGAHVAPGDAVQGAAGAHVAPALEHRGGAGTGGGTRGIQHNGVNLWAINICVQMISRPMTSRHRVVGVLHTTISGIPFSLADPHRLIAYVHTMKCTHEDTVDGVMDARFFFEFMLDLHFVGFLVEGPSDERWGA